MPALSYREKVDILRSNKELETQKKIEKCSHLPVFNTDDKGFVVPPDDWHWEPKPNLPGGCTGGAAAWADNFYSLMDSHPPYVDPYSSMAGAYMYKCEWHMKTAWPEEHDFPELRVFHEKYDLIPGIYGAHHFHHDVGEIGFKLGWKGILENIRKYMDVHAGDPEKLEFLKAEEKTVKGIQQWILHNAEACRKAAEAETDPDLKNTLEQKAAMNFKLASEKPDTFLEACQWLIWFLMATSIYNGSGAGGALDILLKPYFDKEIAEGSLTEEEATYHLACLLLKDTQYYEIGGTWPDGTDRTNRISWLAIEASNWVRIPTALCLRIHEGISRDFVRKSVEYMFDDKCGNPSYIGDRCMVEGFMRNGYPEELARTRYKTGCNWCNLPGIEYTLNDTVKVNMAKLFEVAFLDMMEGGEHSSAKLWELFDRHMGIAVDVVKQSIDLHVKYSYLTRPELALNFMCHGPIEKGFDISHGSVDYYNFGVDFCALGTVADSFAALERAVEHDRRIGWQDIGATLRNNWEGREDLRLYMRNTPHYGYGGTKADEYASRIVERMTYHTKKSPTPDGWNCIPGMFSWANTIGLGKTVMATPNGRKAGEPITHGANPEPGFRESGALTAMGLAVASVQPRWGNTAPIQLEIDPGLARGEQGIDNITDFLMTYCNDLGGSLVNINIVDRDKLLDAYDNPEKYPDLVVRITGFSVYFCTLSKDFRKLVVDRIIQN